MKPWKAMLCVNVVLLPALALVTGPLRSPLGAQGPFAPYLSPCCKTAIEGGKFCCQDCCGSGYQCSSACSGKKKT